MLTRRPVAAFILLIAMVLAGRRAGAGADGAPAPTSRRDTLPLTSPATLPSTSPVTHPTTEAATQPAPTTSPAGLSDAAIEPLLRRLGEPGWKTRDAAQAELVRLGADAEPALRRSLRVALRPEVRQRVQSILAEIEEQRRTGPTLITFHAHGAAARDVFDAIFHQAKSEYVTYPSGLFDPGQTVNVDFDKTPFLVALKRACDQTGLNVRKVYDPHRMTLIAESAGPMKGPSVIQGPVMVSASGIRGAANISWVNGAAPAERSGAISISVLIEPRLHATNGFVTIDKLDDEHGDSLLLKGDAAMRAGGNSGLLSFEADFAWEGRVPLKLPRGSTKIAAFEGSVHLLAHTATERVEIDDILKANEVTHVVGGKRFVVHKVTSDGNTYEVTMTLYRGDMSDGDWAWFGYPYGRFRLVDAGGRDLSPSSGGGGGNDKSEFTIRYTRDTAIPNEKPGEPVKLIWDLPVNTRELVVPFSFKDLPLP